MQVRSFYVQGLSAGLRNDVTDVILNMRQRWRLSEIRLEEFNFVVLSRLINALEELGGAGLLCKANNMIWSVPVQALVLGVRNMALSHFEPAEAMAVDKDIQVGCC